MDRHSLVGSLPLSLAVAWMSAAANPADGGPAGMMRYERMSPREVSRAVEKCPVAYVSAGIVEWHGEQSACGLDGLKAESLCWMASELLGGVCFPHVWLGPDASTPFDPTRYPRGTVTIDKALYQAATTELLTRIQSMGFRVAVYLSGHYPGVIPAVANRVSARTKMKVISVSENRVVQGLPAGDHAATWETALLDVLRPGLVDLTRLPTLPASVKHAGEVVPPQWKFRQRTEYYGVYGSDPRIWANAHFGRLGAEAVIDGLAREVGKALGDPSYGQRRRPITWPVDSRQHPEVRYDYQLPYQWIRRFERAPVVFVPLPAIGEPIDRAVDLARRTGGLAFPPIRYAPSRGKERACLSADVFTRVVREVALDLVDMDFRVVVLLPGEAVDAEIGRALGGIDVADGQARVLVVEPSALKGSTLPARIDEAIRAFIPTRATIRPLADEWRISRGKPTRRTGQADDPAKAAQTHERAFELSEAEAAGAVLLDLGAVENHCEVVVNDAPPLADHWPPYRFILTGRVKPGSNRLRVTVRHEPQPTLDTFFYRAGSPTLRGPVTLSLWKP